MQGLGESYDQHRRAIFGLCYRMTGSAADAEDLVQETFSRALERPPADRAAPLRPWLTRVAVNLCIDALRKRKRERYFGPWLPAPVETERLADDLEPGPDARIDRLESASAAFLRALEALDPRQRAVLVLRDVLGMSGAETAEALSLSSENVRVIHHRARKALESYEASRNPPTEEVRAKTADALRRLMAAFAARDFDALRAMLAEDARSTHDAGGEFHAAVRVVQGRDAIVELYANLAGITGAPTWLEERDYNGLPAVAFTRAVHGPKEAPRLVVQVELDREGRVREIVSVLATRKLAAVRFPEQA